MSPVETYNKWRQSLKHPDDSVFYYHKDLERILLGLAIFVIASRPTAARLGKAEMLKILHFQVPDIITAWIDDDDEAFDTLFPMLMVISEGYVPASIAAEKRYPANKKAIRTMAQLFANACGAAGDMHPSLAEELLDDLSTDGKEIYSEKIKTFGQKLLLIISKHGINIPPKTYETLIGW